MLGIKTINSAPYHPQSNGSLERKNQTLKRLINSCINLNNGVWSEHLPKIISQVNHTRNESIGMTPFEAFRGSYASGHFGSKTFVADAVAHAKFVRSKILKNLEKSREKMQNR